MKDLFKNISLRWRFMLWSSIVVTFAIIIAGALIYSLVNNIVEKNILKEMSTSTHAIRKMIETSLQASVRSHLRAIGEKNVSILQELHQEVLSGKMSTEEARKLGRKILLSQPIGRTGYIYALTSDGIPAVHPWERLENRDLSEHWLVKKQIAEKNGYVEYQWKNPGEQSKRPKILYMSYFEPWDWIISVSTYKEELHTLLNISNLKKDIISFRLGDRGFAFIMNHKGRFVVPPSISSNTDGNKRSDRWNEIFNKMSEMKNGQFHYRMNDPQTGKKENHLLFFNYLPQLQWFVATSVVPEEFSRPLENIRNVIFAAIGGVLLFILPLSFYLGNYIARPLIRLARKMKEADAGNFDVRADENASGEVGSLAIQFNTYMDQLKNAHEEIREEMDERARAQSELKLFAQVFENALEGISITDINGNIIAVNQAFTEITGYTEQEVLGRNPRILKSDRQDSEFYRDMWNRIIQDGYWSGEIWNRRKNGEAFPETLNISAIQNSSGETTHYVAVFHDISEMKSQQEKIRYQAYHDALTGLPNRNLARDRLLMAIARAGRDHRQVAVIFLDMDNFKYINDSLGHITGDILLTNMAERLKRTIREQDTAARLGGDEFLVIAVDIESEHEVMEIAHRLLAEFKKPITAGGHTLFITMSIGIAMFPQDGSDADTLIKNADTAMYQSKSMGKDTFHMFTRDLSEQAAYHLQLINEFRGAVDRKEFMVYYQPKVHPETHQVKGLEALVRWHKEDGSVVSPADFIPLAEETGLILPLGMFVLKQACLAIKELNQKNPSPLSVAVNLSPLQFKQPDLVSRILDILTETGLPASSLELEITESTMMKDLDESIKKLDRLKQEGITVSIDDFGTGYSSLYYLKILPISTLKIDRSFIRDITTDPNDAQLVETIILMAKNLNIGVVAEGVETEEQLDMLNQFGCRLVQGYYFARPMPTEDLAGYLDT